MDKNTARDLLPGTVVRDRTGLCGTLRKFDCPADVAGWIVDWARFGPSFSTLADFAMIEIYIPTTETPLGEQIDGGGELPD